VDAEIGLAKAAQQKQPEKELGLKPVNEFEDAQYMSKGGAPCIHLRQLH
jgi:hypothetical protein